MAVIYRQRLTGQALDIKNQALKKAQADPLLGGQIVALNQQRTILQAQQQGLISGVQASLRDVSTNIYQAQRQAKANSAALGYVGSLTQLRNQSDLQSQISYEYANLINQAEQGAISIAGQQTALNKAEVQLAQDAILNEYVDTLIKDNQKDIIDRDYNRELNYQFQQAGLGLLKGLGIGLGIFGGVKGLLNPSNGWVKKGIAGAFLAGSVGMGIDSIVGAAGGEQNLNAALLGSAIPGAVIGGAYGIANKVNNRNIINRLGQGVSDEVIRETIAKQGWGAVPYNKMKTTFAKSFANSSLKTSGSFATNVIKNQAAKNVLSRVATIGGKLNPWALAIAGGTSLLFGILEGVRARNTKFYKIDYDAFVNLDASQQFADLGLDLEAVKDIVYNKRG